MFRWWERDMQNHYDSCLAKDYIAPEKEEVIVCFCKRHSTLHSHHIIKGTLHWFDANSDSLGNFVFGAKCKSQWQVTCRQVNFFHSSKMNIYYFSCTLTCPDEDQNSHSVKCQVDPSRLFLEKGKYILAGTPVRDFSFLFFLGGWFVVALYEMSAYPHVYPAGQNNASAHH